MRISIRTSKLSLFVHQSAIWRKIRENLHIFFISTKTSRAVCQTDANGTIFEKSRNLLIFSFKACNSLRSENDSLDSNIPFCDKYHSNWIKVIEQMIYKINEFEYLIDWIIYHVQPKKWFPIIWSANYWLNEVDYKIIVERWSEKWVQEKNVATKDFVLVSHTYIHSIIIDLHMILITSS